MDFGTFQLISVIMHQIPKGRYQENEPDPIDYSEAPIELKAEDIGFIQMRLRATLGGRARPVIEDTELGSPIPDIVRDLVKSSTDMVIHSREITHQLYSRQKWVSPGGLVMTIIGKVDNEPCIVLAKMEHQEGMRVESTHTVDGLRTYRAQYLHDLILGQGTRVYKTGIFAESGSQAGKKLRGQVVDDQQAGGGVAEYFVDFLGCRFVQRADVLTEKFYKTTHKFISAQTRQDPEANASYHIALLSELQSQTAKIRPQEFANKHLPPAIRDEYISRVEGVGIPAKEFTKDLSLIESVTRRMRIHTESGADVFIPPEMMESGKASVKDSENGQSALITVEDKVTGIAGASGKRPI